MTDSKSLGPFNAFFMGTLTMFRVYPAPGALFFIVLEAMSSAGSYQGGALGMLIVRIVHSANKKKREKRAVQLDEMSIKDRMETAKGNFRIAYTEITSSKIQLMRGLFGPRKAARATWSMTVLNEKGKEKKQSFVLEGNQQLESALRAVEPALAQKNKTLVKWDDKKARYVKRNKKELIAA